MLVVGNPAQGVWGGGVEVKRHNDDCDDRDDGGKISDAEATRFRAMLARCNFLGSDRPDVHFAAKEASRSMAAARGGDRDRQVLEWRAS